MSLRQHEIAEANHRILNPFTKEKLLLPRPDGNRFRDDGRELVHAAQTRDIIAQWVRLIGEPV